MTQPRPTPGQFAEGGVSGQVLTHSGADIAWTTVSSSSASLTKTTASRTSGSTPVVLTVPAGEDVVCMSIDTGGGVRVSVSGFDTTVNTADRSFKNHYENLLGLYSQPDSSITQPYLYGIMNYYVVVSYTASTRTVSIELKSESKAVAAVGAGTDPTVTTVLAGAVAIEMWSS
tara:strand:- start:239 stop:757 length:519 start_codon:yes stop_codon:yes gene_type:complete